MKAFLLALAIVGLALQAFSQDTGVGRVGFSSAGTAPDNRVYVTEDPATPYMEGVPAAGSAYYIAFFWSHVGSNRWTQIGNPNGFLTGGGAGQWLGGGRSITGLQYNGQVVDIQARAWETAFGTNYESVVATGNPMAHAGVSAVVTIKTKDPYNTLETTPTLTSHTQWVGFALAPVAPRAQTFSVNAIGYHEVHVPAGFYLVANNLNYKSNLLNDVLPLPEWAGASEFFKFDGSRQAYFESTLYLPGWGWLSAASYEGREPEPTLRPGEGAFLRVFSNGVPAPITLTFVGDVAPRSCATIYAGWNQWSPSLGGDLSEIRPVDGDTVFTYDMLNQAYRDPWQYIEGLGWLNASDPDIRGPRIPPGQCVFLFTHVTRNPCVFEGAGPASVLSPLAGVTLINPARSGSSFSFEYIAEAGRIHHVQYAGSFPATWTSQGEPTIGANQRVNYTDSTASGPSRYYRLLIQ